jgi:hypothetical protein
MREVIGSGLLQHPKGDPIRKKYKWLKKYFNNVIDTLGYAPDVSDWYEGDAIQLYKALKI